MHFFIPQRCAACGKIMYHDKATAQRAADRSFVERSRELWVYRCRYCGAWHLTSQDPQYRSARNTATAQRRGGHPSRKRGYKPRNR
ncbi:MAG: hypothetical protein LKI88_02845 [Bifidobacterium sp.]|nr:hypothetical protein [Bifidobacterium sp.]MCI1864856.1 hypothetical protein [Bifidobacterium sp.]